MSMSTCRLWESRHEHSGYGRPAVDDAVHKTIEAGNMSTLNRPEEVFLAEWLVEMHP